MLWADITLSAGYSEDIAKVCEEHYAPKGPNDPVPKASISVAVSLADKLDTLLGFGLLMKNLLVQKIHLHSDELHLGS